MYNKSIQYDTEARDFAMYLDGELVGFARTYQEAEVTLDQLIYELITGDFLRPEIKNTERTVTPDPKS